MTIEQKKNFIINIIYSAIIVAIVYIIIKHILVLFMPFIIGDIVTLLLRPVINFVYEKFHIPYKAASIVIVLLSYGVIILFISWIGVHCLAEIKDSIVKLSGTYVLHIEPMIRDIFESVEKVSAKLDPMMVHVIRNIIVYLSQSANSAVSNIYSMAIQVVSSLASSLPDLFLGIIFAIISSLFFAIDYSKITFYISKKFKSKNLSFLNEIKCFAVRIGFKYVKAYGILMTVTFLELTVGFSILRVDRAVTAAAIIAVIDLLPLIGTGGIIIPWIIIEFIKGNLPFAVGLTVLYLIITVVRNVLEPKLVGKQIGLHPIIMIVCMYAGLKVFGFLGLIALPVTIAFIKYLYDNDKLHSFKQV